MPGEGMKWAGAPCPEPLPSSKLSLFLPRRNNFLPPPTPPIPRPMVQELRGEVLGRSFAIWGRTTTLLSPGRAVPARDLCRSRERAGAPGSRPWLECQESHSCLFFFFFLAIL